MSTLVITSGPAAEPVSLTEAKAHLRVLSTAEDALITSRLKAARRWCEHYCRRGFVTQTARLRMDEWPDDGVIYLPWGKVASVSSISYVDGNGDTQTLDSARYQSDLDGVPARIAPAWGYTWPAIREQLGSVSVTYVVGASAASVDDDIKAAILLVLGDLYENREGAIIGVSRVDNPTVTALLTPHRCDILGAELIDRDDS